MGPSASIVLAREPTDIDRAAVEDLIHRLGELAPSGNDGPDVFISTTEPIAGNYSGEGRPFWLNWVVGEEYSGEDEDHPTWRAEVQERFGLTPIARLTVSAGLNRPEDHRVLGDLALHLARHFAALIDFHGALIPSTIRSHFDRLQERSWPEFAEAIRSYFSAMPGRILDIEYRTANDRRWAFHVADHDFMAAWLRHDDFHMIK